MNNFIQYLGISIENLKQWFRKVWRRLMDNKRTRIVLQSILIAFGIISFMVLVAGYFLFFVPATSGSFIKRPPTASVSSQSNEDPSHTKVLMASEKELQQLRKKYDQLTPTQNFLVINTTYNLFYFYSNKELVREGFCSSGSYVQLKSHDEREWTFKTPKGRHRIQGKITSPVWRRPDWAFIEEGLPVPSGDHPSRYEAGVLGDYALSLGDGYLIHGTIYKRFLGMPVTHGCIRLADDDLEFIYNSLQIGSRVYIY